MFSSVFSSEKSCSQNKVCCLNDYIVLTDNSKPIFVPVTKENVTDRSCGIGMPNSQYYDDNIGTRIVASGAFTRILLSLPIILYQLYYSYLLNILNMS